MNSRKNLDKPARVHWPSSRCTGMAESSHCTCPHHNQHCYGQNHEKQSQQAYKNLNAQRSQTLLNKSRLMLINIKAGQNLLWFKLALSVTTKLQGSLAEPVTEPQVQEKLAGSVNCFRNTWWYSPHRSMIVGNGSQPANHRVISHAFCLFYEKEVLPTGFRWKFFLIRKERKFI